MRSQRSLLRMQASDTLAELLEKAGKEAAKPAARGKAGSAAAVPALQALFQVGQLVRATIIGLEEGPSGDQNQFACPRASSWADAGAGKGQIYILQCCLKLACLVLGHASAPSCWLFFCAA